MSETGRELKGNKQKLFDIVVIAGSRKRTSDCVQGNGVFEPGVMK